MATGPSRDTTNMRLCHDLGLKCNRCLTHTHTFYQPHNVCICMYVIEYHNFSSWSQHLFWSFFIHAHFHMPALLRSQSRSVYRYVKLYQQKKAHRQTDDEDQRLGDDMALTGLLHIPSTEALSTQHNWQSQVTIIYISSVCKYNRNTLSLEDN